MSPLLPNEHLKQLRLRLGISTREVADLSRQIADAEQNDEFHISYPWLTQIENSNSVPSIYKLYTLSAIYKVRFSDLLRAYGVQLENLSQHQVRTSLPNTHLAITDPSLPTQSVTFPVRFDPAFNTDQTNLLARMVETWGEIPISLLEHLDLRERLYGYVGLKDVTLYPLLRPGSFVLIDPRYTRVQTGNWRSEFERPIYFVELRDGYACSWCELQDRYLLLIPHPLSPCGVRRFVYGTEAEIIGMVSGIAMPLENRFSGANPNGSRTLRRSES